MADNLSKQQADQIKALQNQWKQANASGDKKGMEAAHNQAESIRKAAGYSGGADGSQHIVIDDGHRGGGENHIAGPGTNVYNHITPDNPNYVNPNSNAAKIAEAKRQYEIAKQANDQAAMDAAHKQAEAIRAQAGFSGGADGSQFVPNGKMSADEMAQWVYDYNRGNQVNSPHGGGKIYGNGYSVDMNLRSIANKIRQQMQANSNAWSGADAEQQKYLHDQNLQLAELLRQSTGGAESTFNPQTGRWETWEANYGYGTDMNFAKPDQGFHKDFYGMTDDQIKQYANDTDRYHNFVDVKQARNQNDESSGFTGRYSQFVNGPYAGLIGSDAGSYDPRAYLDLINDGFNEGKDWVPVRDENGNVIPQAPALKGGQFMDDYTRQHLGHTENGIIQPSSTNSRGSYSGVAPSTGQVPNNPLNFSNENMPSTNFVQSIVNPQMPVTTIKDAGGFGGGSGYGGGSFSGSYSGGGASDLSGMIQSMGDANLKNQLAQLEAAYQQSMTDLDAAAEKADAEYTEQKRQATGKSDLDALNWREMANARGVSNGVFGQAALSQNNSLQNQLSALGAAQAAAAAQIERERALLGKQKQLQILEAHARNDYDTANRLYQEAVRQDNALRQQMQFNAQMAQHQMDKIMSLASKGIQFLGPGGTTSDTPRSLGPGEEPAAPAIQPISDNAFQGYMEKMKLFRDQGRIGAAVTDIQDRLNAGGFTQVQQDQLERFLNGLIPVQ